MNKFIISFLLTSFVGNVYSQRIVGYIPGAYSSIATMDATIDWGKMTEAYYFDAEPTVNGGVSIGHQDRFDHVKTRASQNTINVWLSIGGYGKSDNFPSMAANSTYRQNFADNLVQLCADNGLTGIDLDWEFPEPGSEAANFSKLLKVIRETFDSDGNGYKLTIAVGGDVGHADYVNSDAYQYIDYLNIMSYDAPSTNYTNHASLQFLKDAMEIFYEDGCDYSKMMGGAAFYSRPTVKQYSEILNTSSNKQNKKE